MRYVDATPSIFEGSGQNVMMKLRISQFSTKTTYSTLFMLCLLTADSPRDEQTTVETASVHCEAENTVFAHGEEITYAIYYNLTPIWIKAGEVTFTIEDRDDHYFVQAVGTTASSFEWFFKVYDVYTCELDKKTLKPIRSTRDVSEGNYTKIGNAEFDYNNQQIIAHTGKTEDNLKKTVLDMGECTHDVLSIIYFARNIDFENLEEGQYVPADIFLDDEKYNVGFFYDGIDNDKKIKKLGRFETVRLRPQLVEGYVFGDDPEMQVWASNDENRLPLLVESPVSIGSVKAVLKSYKNLRYPFEYE